MVNFYKGRFTYFHNPASNYHLLSSILRTSVISHIYWILTHINSQIFVVKSRVHIFASSGQAHRIKIVLLLVLSVDALYLNIVVVNIVSTAVPHYILIKL